VFFSPRKEIGGRLGVLAVLHFGTCARCAHTQVMPRDLIRGNWSAALAVQVASCVCVPAVLRAAHLALASYPALSRRVYLLWSGASNDYIGDRRKGL